MQSTKSKRRWPVIAIGALVVIALGLLVWPNLHHAQKIAQTNSCICTLRQIDGAIQQWALEHKKAETNYVTWGDIAPYFKGGIPDCPAGGAYKIGPTVSNVPRCTVAGHALPE